MGSFTERCLLTIVNMLCNSQTRRFNYTAYPFADGTPAQYHPWP